MTITQSDLQAEDDAYESAPLQFAADRMSELFRTAETALDRQVTVHASTMHKLYLAYTGVLEIYRSQIAGAILINGTYYNCSLDLRDAIAPIVDEHRRNLANIEIDKELERMRAEAAASSSNEIASIIEAVTADSRPRLH